MKMRRPRCCNSCRHFLVKPLGFTKPQSGKILKVDRNDLFRTNVLLIKLQ